MDKQTFSLGSFMDSEVDALPDRPVRLLLPTGRHILQITNVEIGKLGDKEAVIINYKYIQGIELKNASDELPEQGAELQETFFTESQGGLGQLKEYLQNVKTPRIKIRELLPALQGEQVEIVSTVRKWKDKNSGEQREGWNTVGGIKLMGAQAA